MDLEAVVVFTDGLNNDSNHDLGDVIRAAKDKELPVFVVGLGLVNIFSLLKLSSETGGGFVYVPTGDRLLEAFETLTEFIVNTYVIEWPNLSPLSRSPAIASGT